MPCKTFNIINFGCRATQADGAALEQAFLREQFQKSDQWNGSDIVVINTCTVTHAADTEARAMIRRVHRENPRARIVVTGCYAQRAPREVAAIEGVSSVFGNSHKHELVSIVARQEAKGTPFVHGMHTATPDASVYCSSIFESQELRTIGDPGGGGRTRAVLKVQDGCSYRCSFCVIPQVRGDSRSLSPSEVVRQTRILLDQGHQEITLTGIHLGGFGRDLEPKQSLAQLVRILLREDRLLRLRLSSIEPLEYSEELIDLVAESPKMAKHFHVPLQSGSDRILRLMRRPYTAEFYQRLVEKMRQRVPEAAIGADVMVGFPTETDEDHQETITLLNLAPMTYLHVFPYSARPGTPSALIQPGVANQAASRRSEELRGLANAKNRAFKRKFVGEQLEVLTLTWQPEEKFTPALSSNYLKVAIAAPAIAANQFKVVTVTGENSEGLCAEPVH
ncbi:MAG: tRNA (N(6)-L-threonylcarbamoyladenosine(37)-C(2))-methylthiotransferase MtaB [Terriglobia bacterium]